MHTHHRLHDTLREKLFAMERRHPFGWEGHDDRDQARCAGRRSFGGRHDREDFGFFGDWNGFRGGGRRGGGRMFGHGDLKLLLLALIEQEPRHGYELIRTIEDMFHGQYSPSPGTVYPTLTLLEEMGYVVAQSEEGGRKRYAITDEGRAFLDVTRAAWPDRPSSKAMPPPIELPTRWTSSSPHSSSRLRSHAAYPTGPGWMPGSGAHLPKPGRSTANTS